MPEPSDQPAKPLRTWRPMAAWTAGIVTAAGLTWFIADLCFTLRECREALIICTPQMRSVGMREIDLTHAPPALVDEWRTGAIKRLGGEERAARSIVRYLRWPEKLWPHRGLRVMHDERRNGLYLLHSCGKPGVPGLIWALSDESAQARLYAASYLGVMGPDAESAIPALEKLLGDKEGWVRSAAAEALTKLRGEEK